MLLSQLLITHRELNWDICPSEQFFYYYLIMGCSVAIILTVSKVRMDLMSVPHTEEY